MNIDDIIYNKELSQEQNFNNAFNLIRFCIEQFENGRVSIDNIESINSKINKVAADESYLSMMTGIDIPNDGGSNNE